MTEVVTLHVGDRTFKTQKATLLKIPYFNDYFSEKTGTEPRLDGTYFVDLDGGTFEHILKFARHGTLPLFWTHAEGFDRQKYHDLAQQADFLNLIQVAEWIKEERFKKAVETRKFLGKEEAEIGMEDTVGMGKRKEIWGISGKQAQAVVAGCFPGMEDMALDSRNRTFEQQVRILGCQWSPGSASGFVKPELYVFTEITETTIYWALLKPK